MAGINNKQELLERLAGAFFQGFGPDGTPMIFSIFDDMEKKRGQEINIKIGHALAKFLRQQAEVFETTPIEYIQTVLADLELDTPEEVGQFLWHAGYMWGLLESTVANEKRKRDEEDGI